MRQKEEFQHFPFVSGELIEKHRASLGAQLKSDMQNYLTRSRGRSPPQESSVVVKSASTQQNTLLNSRARALKPIFDSEYVKPDENHRVVQDDSLKKSSVFTAALQRYEASLKHEQSVSGKQKEFVQQRIESAQKDRGEAKDKKKKAQSEYKESILQQMAEQVSSILSLILNLFCFFCSLYKSRSTSTNTGKPSRLDSLPRPRKARQTRRSGRRRTMPASSRRPWTLKSQRDSNMWKPNERRSSTVRPN